MTEYCFVKDANGKVLSPTKIGKGWYLIRKNRATLVSKYPMVIKLARAIHDGEEDESEFVVGIDDGSKFVGVAIVQKCCTKNKVVFKGTITQRQDVSHLLTSRAGYRRYRRHNKRYRPARFNNRQSFCTVGRLAPSIKQKKDAIIRVLAKLNKCCRFDSIVLEDVQIDIRKLQDGALTGREYQISNRLDENIRVATLMRDSYTCQDCGARDCKLEAHHIVPRRAGGNDSIHNLITLCKTCHAKLHAAEERFIAKYQSVIGGKNINFAVAQHVMQGKNYLRGLLRNIATLSLTIGSITATNRIGLGILKTHSNDAVVITGLVPGNIDLKDWVIKPMRTRSKAAQAELAGFKHRDFVRYTKRNGESYIGYIRTLYPAKKQFSMATIDGKDISRYGIKSLKLLWRFSKVLMC